MTWLKALKYKAGGKTRIPCIAGACHAGCGRTLADCKAEWKKVAPDVELVHGALPTPLYREVTNNPNNMLLLVGFARGGGLLQHEKKIEPLEVREAVVEKMVAWQKHQLSKGDGPQGGALVDGNRGSVSTLASLGAAGDEVFAPAIGGGALGVWCRGRGGRKAPKVLVDLHYADHEADLDATVNDPDVRPAAPADGTQRVPVTGLGDFWKLDSASPEEQHREAAAEWVAAAPTYVADLVGQADSVRSYSRSLAAHLLLAEMPDPKGAGISPDEAWGLVRLRAFELASTSTDSTIARWAGSFADEFAEQEDDAAAAVGGSGRSVAPVSQLPDFLKPGESGTAVLFGERWGVKDHGELLSVGGDEPERAKCLYLSIAAALKVDPSELLSSLRARARQFVAEVPAPKAGELVPEAVLYAFELAHDLLERDHPQMRASLLWFGDVVFAAVQLNFICVMPDGDVRVEFFVGREFSADAQDSKLGWVICASAHARELVSPVPLDKLKEWELVVMEATGVAPGLFYMSGYAHLIRALRSFRGDHRVRDPGSLFKCEICPSLHARPLRVRQRRFIGADATGDPLLVMVAEAGLAPLVKQSRMIMAGMSADRESAAAAAVAAVLAGDAVDSPVGYSHSSHLGFASAWDERLGRSTVREFSFKGFRSAKGVFSASLSCGSGLGPAVDRFLRREDPQFSRVDATAVAALRSFDVALAGLAASSGRPERAASSSSRSSPAADLHDDLEQGSSSDLAQVGEDEDNLPSSDAPTPTPLPFVSSPTPLPTSDPLDMDEPGGGPCTHPEYDPDTS